MYAIIQVIKKSRSCSKPQLVKNIFDSKEEAAHYIRRYRDRFPYTTAEFAIAEIELVSSYETELVEKPVESEFRLVN